MKIDVVRTYFTREFTKGVMFVDDVFFGYTLEPEMKTPNEQSYVNRCISTGSYQARYEYSVKFKRYLIELKRVPNHDEIKIHNGNYREHTRGCILIGKRSGKGCVLESVPALNELNNKAYWVAKKYEEIDVNVSCYLGSDDRINEDILRESRQ